MGVRARGFATNGSRQRVEIQTYCFRFSLLLFMPASYAFQQKASMNVSFHNSTCVSLKAWPGNARYHYLRKRTRRTNTQASHHKLIRKALITSYFVFVLQ